MTVSSDRDIPFIEIPGHILSVCALEENIPKEIVHILGARPPRRWGRMDVSGRAAVVAVAMIKQEHGIVTEGLNAGFVVGSRYGSLAIDLSYAETLSGGQPSPILFSYTLPNIAPSEAAAFFGLTGPVFAILDQNDPFSAAMLQCRRLITFMPGIDLMFFAHIDLFPADSPCACIGFLTRAGSDCNILGECGKEPGESARS